MPKKELSVKIWNGLFPGDRRTQIKQLIRLINSETKHSCSLRSCPDFPSYNTTVCSHTCLWSDFFISVSLGTGMVGEKGWNPWRMSRHRHSINQAWVKFQSDTKKTRSGLSSQRGKQCPVLILPRYQAVFPCREEFPSSRQKEAAAGLPHEGDWPHSLDYTGSSSLFHIHPQHLCLIGFPFPDF